MNKYPAWKYLLLIVVILVGFVYALPNIYGDDPAVQISSRGGTTDDALEGLVETALSKSGISSIGTENNKQEKNVKIKSNRSAIIFPRYTPLL